MSTTEQDTFSLVTAILALAAFVFQDVIMWPGRHDIR